ncbi:MAG: hypothetical protein RBR42_04980 [Desulfomicrobium sp.]|nr:hypothetical protein [Desulfomicrobium sp.]
MKQICAKCKGTNVVMLTDGRSSDRIEEYECKDCMIVFFAKRPTKRIKQEARERQELLDHFAGLAMASVFASGFDGTFRECAQDAYDMAEVMLAEREARKVHGKI